MTHREACYELRRTARLLADEKITLDQWYESVCRILTARDRRATSPQPVRLGASL